MQKCGDNQICVRLAAGIKGVTHERHMVWLQKYPNEEWGYLIVDIHNLFNDKKCKKCFGQSVTSGLTIIN